MQIIYYYYNYYYYEEVPQRKVSSWILLSLNLAESLNEEDDCPPLQVDLFYYSCLSVSLTNPRFPWHESRLRDRNSRITHIFFSRRWDHLVCRHFERTVTEKNICALPSQGVHYGNQNLSYFALNRASGLSVVSRTRDNTAQSIQLQ